MPFMNFKIVNAKNFKMQFKKTAKIWHIDSLRFNHWLAHRDIKEAL